MKATLCHGETVAFALLRFGAVDCVLLTADEVKSPSWVGTLAALTIFVSTRNENLWPYLLGAAVVPLLVRRWRRFEFRGRTVFIAGGSRGLGFALARRLLELGARVAICARDPEMLAQARAKLPGPASRLLILQCDITSREAVGAAILSTIKRFGCLDVLINNAGMIQVGPPEAMTAEDYEQTLKTHFWGPFHTIQAVLPHFRQRGQGRIVNISSVGGKISVPHLLPYSVSKFALTGFSEGLSHALRKENIYVTTVCPGLMRTGSPRNADFKGQHRLEYAWFSVSDSLPGLSMNVDIAARRILRACAEGRSELLLGLPTKIAVRAQSLFPNFSSALLGYVSRALPATKPGGEMTHKGRESFSPASPSLFTVLNEKAARKNNQLRVA